MTDFDTTLTHWAEAANPFFAGASADLLSLIPYAGLMFLLYWVAREKPRT
jgi:hypothetical protein